MGADLRPLLVNATTRGVHHLALCTDDMKATIDFYVEVLGMHLVHARLPPDKIIPYRNPDHRELFLSGLRLAADETE
jgi:catechol 2,3-dioxygenase-like lactoylglutathione lyase family enzyme